MSDSAGTSGQSSMFTGPTVSLTATSLPVLAGWLENMGRQHESISEILYTYVELVLIHLDRMGLFGTRHALELFHCQLSELHRQIRLHYHPDPVPAAEQTAPTFLSLWTEVRSTFPTGDEQWMKEDVDCGPGGIKLPRFQAFILQCLLRDQSRRAFTAITQYLAAQPLLQGPFASDTQPDLPVGEVPVVDACRALIKEAVAPFLQDRYLAYCMIGAVTGMVAGVVQHVNSEDNQSDSEYVNERLSILRGYIWDPFSSKWPMEIREQLANTDLKLYIRLLIIKARMMRLSHNPSELGWRLHGFILMSILIAAEPAQEEEEHMLWQVITDDYEWAEWVEFLDRGDDEPQPVLDFVPEIDLFSRVEYEARFIDLVLDPHGVPLQDVRFEPDGPPLQVSNYAVPTTEPGDEPCTICYEPMDGEVTGQYQPMKVPCGHCFHFECLEDLINGINKYSNLCPMCRQKISDPRPKKRVVE